MNVSYPVLACALKIPSNDEIDFLTCEKRHSKLHEAMKSIFLPVENSAFKCRYLARYFSRQVENIPAYQADLHDQMVATLQATRLLRYHMDMQLQEFYNLYSVMENIESDSEPEREWVFGISLLEN